MATYRLSAKIVGRSEGRSAVAAAAYRAGERIYDERYGVWRDFLHKRGVLHTEIVLPDNAASWMADRNALWNGVEAAERRKDSQLCRELQLSLPHELTDDERIELVRGFVKEQFVAQGMIADFAVHLPDVHKGADPRNHHAHVMLTMRDIADGRFGNKNRTWNDNITAAAQQWEARRNEDWEKYDDLRQNRNINLWRMAWAEHENRALERAGIAARVDHRSYLEQGVDLIPQPKVGQAGTSYERRGMDSDRAVARREVEATNNQRMAEVIELELARKQHPDPQALENTRAAVRQLIEYDQKQATLVRRQAELAHLHQKKRHLIGEARLASELKAELALGIQRTFRDPEQALAAFREYAAENGAGRAADRLRRSPSAFGRMRGMAVKFLGIRFAIGSIGRQALKEAALLPELARQSFHMDAKVEKARPRRLRLSERLNGLEAEVKELAGEQKRTRGQHQEKLYAAAYELSPTQWAALTPNEQRHVVDARENVRGRRMVERGGDDGGQEQGFDHDLIDEWTQFFEEERDRDRERDRDGPDHDRDDDGWGWDR